MSLPLAPGEARELTGPPRYVVRVALRLEVCGRCGEEVRLASDAIGQRWVHRGDVQGAPADHRAVLGVWRPDAVVIVPVLEPAADVDVEVDEELAEVTEWPEVLATVVDLDDERVPEGARRLARSALGKHCGVRVTYARGPWGRRSRCESVRVMVRTSAGLTLDGLWLTKVPHPPRVTAWEKHSIVDSRGMFHSVSSARELLS